ncbi:FHA domain protein [compost metagenome]
MLFGLTRDFMQQDGIYMMLGEPEGMPASRLNMVQARMLMNTDIPHHLRLLLREIDLKVTMEYAVLRKKMLSHLLKSEKLSMTSFFGLLLQIAQGMEDGRLYMLRADRYALHEDYIFIEGSLQSGKVYLTYVPIQGNESGSRLGESLRALIMVMMASITELAGSRIQRLLQYCGEEEFAPAGLKVLLSELLTEGDSSRRQWISNEEIAPVSPKITEASPIEPERRVQEKARELFVNEVAAPQNKINERNEEKILKAQQNSAPWLSSYSSPRLEMKEEEGALRPTVDDKLPNAQSSRTYLILGCLLGDALLWKFLYLNSPKPLWLAVCGIATIALATLSWMVWSGRIRLGSNAEKDHTSEDSEETNWSPSRRELAWNFGRNPVTPAHPAATIPKMNQHQSDPLSDASSARSESRTEARSAVIPPEPIAPTALLSREDTPEQGKQNDKVALNFPYLKRIDEEEAETETIALNRANFIIGRSAEVAQYVERSEGASRVHAEISKSPSGYVLKDLDSRNGTLFQGETMIPYKEYLLSEGAVFKIVKGSYTFHMR